jgi:tetratricopeptide (TPR) repeat protein
MIPLTPGNEAALSRWARANGALNPLVDEVMDSGVTPDQAAMLETLRKARPFFEGDPFLESNFWRVSAFHQAAAGNLTEAVRDETNALRKGFPQADIFNERGCLRLKLGDLKSAADDFQLALKCVPDDTSAFANLRNLKDSEKSRTGE